MRFRRVEAAAAAQAERASVSLYQLTLNGLLQPFWFYAAFNAVGALSYLLLGHPIVAAVAFAAYCAIDVIQLRLSGRWLAEAHATGDEAGFGKLARLCFVRFSVYLAPVVFIALTGGTAELMLFALEACTLLAVSMAAGMMSRRLFWSFVSPILAALGLVAVVRLAPLQAAGALVSLAALAGLLALMLEGTLRTICAMHRSFNDNVHVMRDLQAARDQAVIERAAADEAREAARQAGRAKANFLATMSHEIRTPMNGVLGMAQLLQRDETDPAQKERLAVLIESGDYLLSILNDILDVSKIDAGRLDILPAPEDLRLFLERVASFWGAAADEKGVALVLDIADSVPRFALVDALRLRQVLFNLIGNALKFTEHGAVEVIAKAMPNGEGAILLHLAVRDTGMGVAAEHLPQLFTRFTQGDESEVRRFGGTGLGLAIAKQLIELMGGRIWAESEAGQGSTFHIKLPLALAEAPAARDRVPASEGPPALESLRILAVDDNAVNLMVLDQLLSSFGHEVVKASGGEEALAVLAEQAFDLVLLDIQMPGMTGVEALQILRAGDGASRSVPVVALTADVTSGGRRRYLDLGFTEHNPKPIQIQELMETIGRAMDPAPPRRTPVRAA